MKFLLTISLFLFLYTTNVHAQYLSDNGTQRTEFQSSKASLELFPNPTIDVFFVKNDKDVTKVVVYNIIGKEIKQYVHTKGAGYSVDSYGTGIYIVRLFNRHNKVLKVARLNVK